MPATRTEIRHGSILFLETPSTPFTHDQNLTVITPGHLLIRPELRYDQAISGTGPFTDSTQHHQFTGGIDVVIAL